MQQLEYDFSNAIGVVLDTTVDTPKVLGQAFLVSKTRMVTNASSVFHYLEAPWALAVKFPFPDVTVQIKAVNLHNDFDKVQARALYLAQTGVPVENSHHVQMNDIAVLIMDPQPPDVPQDRIAELNRALSLPFSGEGVEASGNLRGTEFVQIINTALEAGREGLLTLFDSRNIPIAHISVARGGILKVFYQQVMSSEMAFCELVYRQPASGFAFKPGLDINWGDVPDVQTPPDRLIWEAQRRSTEIPKLLQQLGGTEARYQQVVQNFDPEAASEEIRWMVGPLWLSLDAFTSLDKLPRRVGVDTYTILIAIRELVNRGVASQINRISPFPCTGQMGQPLISHTDFEVHPWDPLQAFFLDPISGRPTWMEGNFFGVANSLQPKNMLHTIAVPPEARGALILKDYKLIGLHIGSQELKPGQPAPPVKCYQFMWMGALLDLSTRKVRSPGEGGDEEGGVGTLRSSLDALSDEAATEVDKNQVKIQCPTCFAVNADYGLCTTCGATIEAPPEEPEPSNKFMGSKPVLELRKIQKQLKMTDSQAKFALGGTLLIPLILMTMCIPKAPPPEANQANQAAQPTIARTKPSDKNALKLAVEEAGFSATAPPMYNYSDTSDVTSPTPSFGLESEQANQKILFIVYDDLAPVQSLNNFVGKPPFQEVDRADERKSLVDSSEQILGAGKLKWILGRYTKPGAENPIQIMLASFPAVKPGKSILVVAQAYDAKKRAYNHKTTLFILDEIASELTAASNEKVLSTSPANEKTPSAKSDDEDEDFDESDDGATKTKRSSEESTSEEIDKFITDAQVALQEKLDLPDNLIEQADSYEAENKKPKKWKEGGLLVGIDAEGNVKRIELLTTDAKAEVLNRTLEKAVQKVAKFADPPVTKKPEFQFQVRLQGKEIFLRQL
ncbi:MAG: hypothetical protein SGJ27_00300 [Candidatus Melainabacteria bacterium]|nr:hypothetical protein [Candidatus Melainabacteria bacterium]